MRISARSAQEGENLPVKGPYINKSFIFLAAFFSLAFTEIAISVLNTRWWWWRWTNSFWSCMRCVFMCSFIFGSVSERKSLLHPSTVHLTVAPSFERHCFLFKLRRGIVSLAGVTVIRVRDRSLNIYSRVTRRPSLSRPTQLDWSWGSLNLNCLAVRHECFPLHCPLENDSEFGDGYAD